MPLVPPGAVGLKFWAPAVPYVLPEIPGTLAVVDSVQYELLLHLDGAAASTTIVDSGGLNRTVTAQGGAQIDTSQAVFAGQALKLSAAPDYLSLDTGNYVFGTGDFCIDYGFCAGC
jgi:hypothetical protein